MVYVSENVAGGRVLAFSKRGTFQRVAATFGAGSVPGSLAAAAGALFVSDEATDQVWRVDPATGLASVWVSTTGAGYALDDPRGLACDGSGNLYVANNVGDAILTFNAAGGLVASVAQDAPEALLWDASAGRLLATVYAPPDIVSIDPASGAVTKLLDNAVASQRFRGLAMVNEALFFTSDSNNRVNRQTGATSFTAADIRLSAPGQILLLAQGADVYPEAKLGAKLLLK
jgi:streptogramin lyase